MKGDIALAGIMFTAEEWQALDAVTRELLVAAAAREDDDRNEVAAMSGNGQPA